MTDQPTTFDLQASLITIGYGKSAKAYLPVAARIQWLREVLKEQGMTAVIETKMIHLDMDREHTITEKEEKYNQNTKRYEYTGNLVDKTAAGFVIFWARIALSTGDVAEATKSEYAVSFPDFIEKAETGALGRVLAFLGFGTQFVGDELDEGQRIVDSPQTERGQRKRSAEPANQGTARKAEVNTGPSTETQRNAVLAALKRVGRPDAVPANLETRTFAEVAELLSQLNVEYNDKKSGKTHTPS